MSSAAAKVGAVLLAALAEASPANSDQPRWVSLGAEAKRRGYSTSGLRAWCLRHGVTIREESHRDAWVSPAEIDRAVEGFAVATRAPSRVPRSEDEEDAREAQRQRDARGPVWLSAEAVPGALLRQSDAGYAHDSNGSRSYPAGPTVRLHRQVA